MLNGEIKNSIHAAALKDAVRPRCAKSMASEGSSRWASDRSNSMLPGSVWSETNTLESALLMPKGKKARSGIEDDRKDAVEPRCRKSNTKATKSTFAKLLINIRKPKYRKSSTNATSSVLIIPKAKS